MSVALRRTLLQVLKWPELLRRRMLSVNLKYSHTAWRTTSGENR
jgi:hypothetical protein